MEKLISFDLEGDFGFFRKPQTNEGVQLSYNLIHRPSLLGILGAILGLEGYKKHGEWPEYYQKLKHLPIGLEPIKHHERGNFDKTLITYTNTVGYANADGNLIVHESTLLQPAFRIYLLLNTENAVEKELLTRIQTGKATYLPYFGKNECPIWWDVETVKAYEFEPFTPKEAFAIQSIFVKNNKAAARKASKTMLPMLSTNSFAYFEEIPIGFNEALFQYQLADIAYTNWKLTAEQDIQHLYQLKDKGGSFIVQLF